MRLKRSNTAACLCAFVSLAVLSATALTTTPALALSEGRVYELVSPVYKGGYGATLVAASPNGESVVFNSLGVFAGVPQPEVGSDYMAHREAGKGWSTTPIQPPFLHTPETEFSSNLEYVAAPHPLGETEASGYDYLLHSLDASDTPETWGLFAPGVVIKALATAEGRDIEALPDGASNDLCHIAINGVGLSLEQPSPPGNRGKKVYDLARGCHGEAPSLRLVDVRNRLGPYGEPEDISGKCESVLGSTFEGEEQRAGINAVSGDGSEFFVTVGSGSGCSETNQLFVRLGGARTVEVSRPVDPSLPFGGCGEGGGVGEVPGEVPCPGAASRLPSFFRGASEDGSRVFFTTGERLVGGETDGSNKLYMASIGCPGAEPGCEPAARRVTALTDVSHGDLVGEAAEVLGVVSVAQDGSHVYFVAHGVLTGTPDGEGVAAAKGADNLYVYDAQTQGVSFIADLCSGKELSGSSEDLRCPSDLSSTVNDTNLWESAGGEAQSTGDGRFLVFSSYGRLIERGPQADADDAKDVYRYDAETGVLDRVSLGEDGFDANGNRDDTVLGAVSGAGNGAGNADATIEPEGLFGDQYTVVAERGLDERAVSEDGSRVIFSSTEPLSPAAINGHLNVYIWQKQPGWSEGRVSMISSGSSLTDDKYPVITPNGENVFFQTSQGLVPADTENDLDVYDARVGGGFPAVAAERVQCSSDACQGALTNPAPLLVPGSVSQAPGGNFAAPAVKPAVKTKPKPKKKTKKKLRKKRKAEAKRTGNDRRAAR